MADKDTSAKVRVTQTPYDQLSPYQKDMIPTTRNDMQPWVPRFTWKRRLVAKLHFGYDFNFFVGHRYCVFDRATGKRVSDWMGMGEALTEADKRDEAEWEVQMERERRISAAMAELDPPQNAARSSDNAAPPQAP